MKDRQEFKRTVAASTLRSCELFAGLPPEDLETVAAFAVVKHLDKDDYLFYESTPSEGFYVVQRGSINVHRVSAAGKEQVIHIFRPGESFAEAALVSAGGYPANARAVETSSVVLLPKKDFVALLRERPDLSLRMLASMSQHLRVVVGLLDDLRLKDVESRLAHWLLQRCPQPPGLEPATVELQQTKRVLAGEIGTTSETLSRTLARFREQDLVEVKGKTIRLLAPLELQRLLRRNLGE